MTKLHTKKQKLTSRRAVAPIIATLLLVAIAVVGGGIIFVFSQGFFSSAQISGSPQIESLEIVGYDMSDTDLLVLHDGFCTTGGIIGLASPPANANEVCAAAPAGGFDGVASDGINTGDRFAVYLQNQSVNDLTVVEALLAGAPYTYVADAPDPTDDIGLHTAEADTDPLPGEFFIVERGTDTTAAPAVVLKTAPQATLEPGEDVTLIFTVDDNVPLGRDVQLKLTTANGNVFVTTLIAGQSSG